MAAELATPTDELTGLPLPIYVTPQAFAEAGDDVDFHHHFHPKKSIELGHIGDGLSWEVLTPEQEAFRLEGKAVRNSRGQLVPRSLHERYHKLFYGPPLPDTRGDKFARAVLACAGVLPREAIELTRSGGFQVVHLSNREFRFMAGFDRLYFVGAHTPKEIEAVTRRDRMGKFFAQYIIEQSAQHMVDELAVQKFLSSSDEQVRRKLGREILEAAIDESVASLIPIRQEAVKEGMVRRKRDLRNVVKQFFIPRRFDDYNDALEASLRLHAGLA